jgi:hypothetical protein
MMLTRYRWYRIQIPSDEITIESAILEKPLTADSSCGFLHIANDIDAKKFRFLWRMKVTVTRIDEEGLPLYEEVASICFLDFAIIYVKDKIFLRIENPGRSNRDLFNALETIFGLGFTSKPITFEKNKPTTIFEKIDITKLVGLKVLGAVVGEDLIARMEFASKNGMNIENMSLLKDLNYKIDSAVYELLYEGVRGQLSIMSNGMVKVNGQLAPKIVNLIEIDLPNF